MVNGVLLLPPQEIASQLLRAELSWVSGSVLRGPGQAGQRHLGVWGGEGGRGGSRPMHPGAGAAS